MSRRLSPEVFDALPTVTLSGLIERPSWQGLSDDQSARAFADALATPRDMEIFNVFVETTMEPGDSPPSTIPILRALSTCSTSAPPIGPTPATDVFLERACTLFRDVVLGPSGLPSLQVRCDNAEEGERFELAHKVLHPDLAALLRSSAASPSSTEGRRAGPVAGVIGAKVVNAYSVWECTLRDDDMVGEDLETHYPRKDGLDVIVVEEHGHSVTIRSAAGGEGPLTAALLTYGHRHGLHPLRRAAIHVTVAFDCLERHPLCDDPCRAGASPRPLPRVIHTLTLEAEIHEAPWYHFLPQDDSVWAVAVRAVFPDLIDRFPALRYFLPASAVVYHGWRVVNIDGAQGATSWDGSWHRTLAFSPFYRVGRWFAVESTKKSMQDVPSDVLAVGPVATKIQASLYLLALKLGELRDEWSGLVAPESAISHSRVYASALHGRHAGLNGSTVGEALSVAIRTLGAAARAVDAVTVGGIRPWRTRGIMEHTWESIEDRFNEGMPADPDDLGGGVFLAYAARELTMLDRFADAAALTREEHPPAAPQAGNASKPHLPVTRADLARISAALACEGSSAPMSSEPAPPGVLPPGNLPWELFCDRRQRISSRRAALDACQLLGLPLKARVIAHYESHHQRLVRGGELKSNLDDAELLLLVAAETTTALLSFLQNPSSGVFNDAASVGDGYGAFRIRMQRETLAHLTTFIRSGHFSLVRDIPITAARKALQTWSSAAQVDWPTYGLSDDAPSYYGGTVSAKDRGALLCAFFFELMYSIRVVGDLARSPEATAGAAAVAAQK